jgi:hypothetical protein
MAFAVTMNNWAFRDLNKFQENMYFFNLILSKSTLKLANETCQKISENNNTLLFITVTSSGGELLEMRLLDKKWNRSFFYLPYVYQYLT